MKKSFAILLSLTFLLSMTTMTYGAVEINSRELMAGTSICY